MIAVEIIEVSHYVGPKQVLENLNFRVMQGEFFGLLGANGSGKTTLLQILATLLEPTKGHVTIAGYENQRHINSLRKLIGMVFQEPALDPKLSVFDNLYLAGTLYGLAKSTIIQRINELLALFELNAIQQSLVYQLSGGMRRAVDIARSLLHRPTLLLLDEPTTGLDPTNRIRIWSYLETLRQKEALTIILTTHDLEEATPCDRIILLHHGKVKGEGAPLPLIQALGHYILEVVSNTKPPALKSLGPALHVGNRHYYQIQNKLQGLDDIVATLNRDMLSVVLRKPTLEDVYLWHILPSE